VFDTTKLEWMNGQYLSALSAEELLAPVERQLNLLGLPPGAHNLLPIIDAVKARSRTILHVAEQVAVRLDSTRIVRDEKGAALATKLGDRFGANLKIAHDALEKVPELQWDHAHLEVRIKEIAAESGLKLGDLMQPVRVALTGGTVSEPVNELLAVVGREESLQRIALAAKG
jgi:glutamyl-tRNA synthetase